MSATNRNFSKNLYAIFLLLGTISITSCNIQSGADGFGFADSKISDPTPTISAEVLIEDISITSFSPDANPVRVADGVDTTFVVSVNPGAGGDVTYSWALNDSVISGESKSYFQLDGTLASAGLNNLKVTAINPQSTDSKTFFLYKNTKPSIDTTSPAATGNNITCGGNNRLDLSLSASDIDADNLSFAWKLNGVEGHQSLSVASTVAGSTARFNPPCSMAGVNLITATVSDGYESTDYAWTVTIVNPLTAQILSFNPAVAPVVIQENDSQIFTVSASGQAPFIYNWAINSDPAITTNEVPSYEALASSFPQPDGVTVLGDHTLTVTVTDDNGSTDNHVFNVKVNNTPTISNPMPVETDIKMNVYSTRAFSITALDLNNDALSYIWTLDGYAPPAGVINGTGNSITFKPNSNLLGDHILKVSVYDGFSLTSTSRSWNVNVNYFTQDCNALTAGQACTILGAAGLGADINPVDEPQTAKMRPYEVVNDGNDNFFILDGAQDVVWFYNRGATDLNIIGTTVKAGHLSVVAGTGAYGVGTIGLTATKYMLAEPTGIAWDSDRGDLYVALRNIHRIVRFTSTGISEHNLCTGSKTNNAAGNTEGAAAKSHHCGLPTGIAFYSDGVNKRVYVGGDYDYIKYFDVTDNDPLYWTGHLLVCAGTGGCTAGSNNGSTGYNSGARANNPYALKVDDNGLVHWTNTGDCRLSVANPTSTTYSFYGGAVTLAPNTSYRVGGSGSCNTYAVGSANKAWSAQRLKTPYGITPYYNGSTYYGWFATNSDHDVVTFFNASASPITIGGVTVNPGMSDHVWGTRVDGYNGDNQSAKNSLLWYAWGMELSMDKNTLYLGDRDNYRLRSLDLSVADGQVSTIIAGKEKADFSGGSNTPAPNVLMNHPIGSFSDPSTNRLIFTDANNCRIRSLNLKTGQENVIVGAGCSNADVEQEDPTDVYMRSPRSVMIHNGGYFYTDSQGGTGVNRNSQVRVYNSNTTATNFFGTLVPGGKVSSVAGSFVLGAQPWDTSYEGQPATTVPLYFASDIVTDGTNLYISDTQSHCILQVDPNGIISTYVGACGTAGYANGSPFNSAAVLLRYPRQLLMDPDNPGNMFIMDQVDRPTSYVRYINKTNAPVMIADQIVSANSIGTVFSTERGFGIATYDEWICYTSGWFDNGDLGNHNVTCKDRTDQFGSTQFRIGPSGGADRAGIQSNTQEEGLVAPGIHLFTPGKLSFDGEGNLYIPEWSGNVIRKVEKWW